MTANPAIDLDTLRRELIRPGGLWRRIDHVAETGSTNADLAAAARAGTVEPSTVLIADFQSAGRGRLGRTWTAPPGTSIAMSVLVRPDGVAPERWTWLPLLTGLAVADGLSRSAGLEVRLKWPNDALLGDRKLCGILAERVELADGPAGVVGMGINTHLADGRPAGAQATSVALAAAAGRPAPDRSEVVADRAPGATSCSFRRWLATPDDTKLVRRLPESVGDPGPRGPRPGRPEPAVEGTADRHRCRRSAGGRASGATRVFGAGDVIHVR